MKKYVLIAGLLVSSVAAMAQKDATTPARYDVAIHFNSMCCGAPDDAFLEEFLRSFSETNKVTVNSYIAGGCGREGEYKILLSYAGLNAKKRAKLKSGLDELIPKQNAENKAANSNSGNIDLQYRPVAADWEGCREAITVWKKF